MSRIVKMTLTDRISIVCHDIRSFICSLLPINKKLIVLNNFDGRGFGDNLAPIANEIIKRNLGYKLVWLTKDSSCKFPNEIKAVHNGKYRLAFYLSRAKIIISNTKSLIFRKRRNSFYIQTWHGGDIPTKLCEKSSENELPEFYVTISKRDSAMTNFVLSGSSKLSEIFKTEFWYPDTCKILEYGTPRKDILFNSTQDDKMRIKRQLFGDATVNVALYAPTFRMYISNDVCRIDANTLQKCLVKKFGGKWIVVIRLHPNVASIANTIQYGPTVINGTQIENGQLLSLVSELLITDYSSIMEDFIIQRKPVFLYIKDIDEYLQKERTLRDFYFQLPLPRCKTETALHEAITNFDNNSYNQSINGFIRKNCQLYDDGHASERVVDLIKSLIEQ